jgi:hypothetical protein
MMQQDKNIDDYIRKLQKVAKTCKYGNLEGEINNKRYNCCRHKKQHHSQKVTGGRRNDVAECN